MILNMKPLNLSEAKDLVVNLEEKKELKDYLKRFGKLSRKDSEKLSDELRKLENIKLKDEYIVKIVDFLPKTAGDLNKVFNDITLEEREINEILEIIQRY